MLSIDKVLMTFEITFLQNIIAIRPLGLSPAWKKEFWPTLLVGKCLTNGALKTLMIWLRSLMYCVSSKIKSLTMSSYDWASVRKPMGSSTRGSDTSSSGENMSINTCTKEPNIYMKTLFNSKFVKMQKHMIT